MIGNEKQYNHVVSIYLSLVDKGVNPLAALDLTNQKIAEKGWTGYATGDNKKFNNVDLFTDHLIDWHKRMYPDSLKAKNFNDFYKGIMITPKYKYNPRGNLYKLELLKTRPGVKKRINLYRSSLGLSPLSYSPSKNNIIYALEGDKILDTPINTPNNKYNLTPRQLAGINKYDEPILWQPKLYLQFTKEYGLDNNPYTILTANEALDSNGYFEMSPLSDIVVTPDSSVYALMKRALNLVPNKTARNALYGIAENYTNKYSSNYGVGRVLDLYEFAGKPKILQANTGLDSIDPVYYPNSNKPRPHYRPLVNTMYVNKNSEMDHRYGDSYNPSDVLSELAHPYLDKVKGLSRLGNIIEIIMLGGGDNKVNGKTGYLRPFHFEYLTHSLVEPALKEYLNSKESLDLLNLRIKIRLKFPREYHPMDKTRLNIELNKLKLLAEDEK